MGIDARILIRKKGEPIEEDELKRLDWEMRASLGPEKFWFSDGISLEEHKKLCKKIVDAIGACPDVAAAQKACEEVDVNDPCSKGETRKVYLEARDKIRSRVLKEHGYEEMPKSYRPALAPTDSINEYLSYCDEEERDEEGKTERDRNIEWLKGDLRDPASLERMDFDRKGAIYTQDGPYLFADENETFYTVGIWTRYYGPGYERGDLMFLCSLAEWIETNIPDCEVWYGGDSSGVTIELFDEAARRELKEHFYGHDGRNYYKRNLMLNLASTNTLAKLQPCTACKPEGIDVNPYMWSQSMCVGAHCPGCGKSFLYSIENEEWVVAEDKDSA